MKTTESLFKEIQLLIQLYESKLSFPRTQKVSRDLENFSFLPEFLKNIRSQFNKVEVGGSARMCMKQEQKALKPLKKLLMIIKIILGDKEVRGSDWLKKRRKNRQKFFKELLCHVHRLGSKEKDFVCHWMDKGFAGYEKDIDDLEQLEGSRTSRKDYEMLLTLRQALWGNVRCLGLEKSTVERMVKGEK